MPALRQGRVVSIPGALLAATSHRRIDTYEWVARALHPERFQ
jgi:iron complex transport system substrate-binding protein